jgi:hypothetical protein
MKRKIAAAMIVALAFSLSAFTVASKPTATGYYWFPLDPTTGDPQPVSTLTYSPSDPYFCTNWAPGGYCSGAFTSYILSGGVYTGAGVEMLVHYSMFN